MSEKIYFVPYYLQGSIVALTTRIKQACKQAGIEKVISKNDLTAIKMHFGELGITSYLRPAYPAALGDLVKEIGAKPYLTDTNTLYRAARHNAVDHLLTAHKNGFSFGTVGVPIIIADGLHGHAYSEVLTNDSKYFDTVQIPDAIFDADSMLVLTHFTAHLASAFGAACKNLSMGCSNPQGKRRMHCHTKPSVVADDCIACGECAKWCPTKAISIDEYAVVDEEICMACGECTVVCPVEAIKIPWDENSSILQEKMAEYAKAVCTQKAGKLFLINCLIDITPQCDCMPVSEPVFRPDIGFLIGQDPVAIDQASLDLVNEAIIFDGEKIIEGKPKNPLKEIYPKIDWRIQTKYGEKIGLGSRDYEIIVCR